MDVDNGDNNKIFPIYDSISNRFSFFLFPVRLRVLLFLSFPLFVRVRKFTFHRILSRGKYRIMREKSYRIEIRVRRRRKERGKEERKSLYNVVVTNIPYCSANGKSELRKEN